MNLLANETSPYLLQHVHNPVHWMPWGEEAFKKARDENKPVLISIGYSSCHWCHVMAHESFEDQETADLMNTLFVNIKVDREEFPDVDHFYMDAVQAMTGSGGWPLNVFTTSDKSAFYGGTYFPPVRAHNRASWKEILINVSQYYTQNRQDVEQQADKLAQHMRQSKRIEKSSDQSKTQVAAMAIQDSIASIIFKKILAQADTKEGGFGNAPKFPSTFCIKYLLLQNKINPDEEALSHALLSLDKMSMGGIYDHVGGGFSRYSTDKYWIAPHFEKMLYDNALLIEVYALSFAQTGNEQYKKIIAETVEWLKREMMNASFGFYSAQDADSEGVEGKYYTWHAEELKSILGPDYEDFLAYFSIREEGNWEHTNILYSSKEKRENAIVFEQKKWPTIKNILYNVRDKRVHPLTDDKILLGWNALMSKALCNAYFCTMDISYLDLAEKNLNYLQNEFASINHLYFHTSKNKQAKIVAYADDLAYLAEAFIELATMKGDTSYLLEANRIVDYLFKNYKDTESYFFNFSHKEYLQVDGNKQDIYDGAIPSVNAVLARVIQYLGIAFQQDEYLVHAQKMREQMLERCLQYPTSFALWSIELQKQDQVGVEIFIIGEAATRFYLYLSTAKYMPNVTYVVSLKLDDAVNGLKGKYKADETLIYICFDKTCWAPFSNEMDALQFILDRNF